MLPAAGATGCTWHRGLWWAACSIDAFSVAGDVFFTFWVRWGEHVLRLICLCGCGVGVIKSSERFSPIFRRVCGAAQRSTAFLCQFSSEDGGNWSAKPRTEDMASHCLLRHPLSLSECNFLDSYILFLDSIGCPPFDQVFQYAQQFNHSRSPNFCLRKPHLQWLRPSVFVKVWLDRSKDQSPLGICGFGALGEGRGEAQSDAQATHACCSRWGMVTSWYCFFLGGGESWGVLFKLLGTCGCRLRSCRSQLQTRL